MPDPSLRAVPIGAEDRLWCWQLRAACRGRPDLFFHPPGEREPNRSRREGAAKRICADCMVQQECAAFALQTCQPYGTWGGMSELERELMLRSGAAPAPGKQAPDEQPVPSDE